MARGDKYEVLGRLPPGEKGATALAVIGGPGGFRRLGVLRPVRDAQLVPVANIDPCLPAPLNIEEVDGTVYAVYDFYPGATLKELVEIYRTMEQLPPLGLVARVIIDAARVMAVAHAHEDTLGGAACFVHGGLGDRTLMLGFDGAVRVLDFGLRAVSRFSSPEAVRGGPFDARSDVFALGAVLHSALTVFGGSYAQVLQTTASPADFPPPSAVHPDASPQLDALVMKALMPVRESRLASAAQLAAELEKLVGAALPQGQACATRIRQLFEARLDSLRSMVPRLESDAGPAKVRLSRPQMPVVGFVPVPNPQRSAGALRAKETAASDLDVDEKTLVREDDGPPTANEGRSSVADAGPQLGLDDTGDSTQVLEVSPSLLMRARPTTEQGQIDKAALKNTQPHADLPWADSVSPPHGSDPAAEPPAEEGDEGSALQVSASMIMGMPSGVAPRKSGGQAAVGAEGDAGAQERSPMPLGDESLEALRSQPTAVHKKPAADAPDDDVKTLVRVSGTYPRSLDLTPTPQEKIDTGIIDARASGPRAQSFDAVTLAARRGRGMRVVLAFVMIAMTAGFGYAAIANPALVGKKINAALIKWKLKKPPPAPPPTSAPSVVAAEPPPAAVIAAADLGDAGDEDDSDAGEEDDEDAGAAPATVAGDAGLAARDGGVASPSAGKHVKKKKHKAWWQTH